MLKNINFNTNREQLQYLAVGSNCDSSSRNGARIVWLRGVGDRASCTVLASIGTLAVSDYNHHMPFLNRTILLYRGVRPSLLLIVGDVTKALDRLLELLTNAGPT